MRWLCTNDPAIWLPLPVPLCDTIYWHTSTFSPPLSERTRLGTPYSLIAFLNGLYTVSDFFVEQNKYTIILEYLSIPPWITIHQRTRLWWPSMCHRLLLRLSTRYYFMPPNIPSQRVGSVLKSVSLYTNTPELAVDHSLDIPAECASQFHPIHRHWHHYTSVLRPQLLSISFILSPYLSAWHQRSHSKYSHNLSRVLLTPHSW